MSPGGPLLVALQGLPGIGKSALTRALGRELGWPVLDKDDLKDVLFGRAEAADELAYDLLFRVVRRQLAQGLSVVCDSPLQFASLYALAQRTAQETGARLAVLECRLAEETEHRRRIEARGRGERSGAWGVQDWPGLLAYRTAAAERGSFQVDAPHGIVDLGQPLDAAVRQAATWVRSLAEPSAGWMPRARWDGLVRGEGCPLCAELTQPDQVNSHGFPVADLGLSRLRLATNQAVAGYCVLICRRHVREPFELTHDEQGQYWHDLLRAGRAIEAVFGPTKLNYQILGNLVPHLHTHVVPRYYGDPAPGRPLDPNHATRLASPDAMAAVVHRLRAALEPG